MKEKKWGRLKVLFIALVVVAPSIWPLFNSQFFQMHDYTHVTRLVEMERAINEGHFPMRWSRNLGYGYGMPLFNFYGPLIYYVGYVILQFGITHITTIKLLFGLNFMVSFLAMFYFARYFWGKWGGLVAATAFIYVPYRAVDFYVRGALGELTGITFIVISLYCLLMLRVKKSVSWAGYAALSIAGLMLSHNLMALIGIPALIMVAVGLLLVQKSPRKIKWIKIKRTVVAFALGVGLSSFYWAPALVEKSATSVDVLVNEAGHYSLHFAYLRQFINSPWGYNGSVWGVDDELSFEIGKIHLVLLILSGFSLYIAWKRGKSLTMVMLVVSGMIIVASILLSTQKTILLWQTLPGLNYLQFPWRFLSLIIVFSSFIAGGFVLMLSSKYKKYERQLAVVVMLVLIAFNLRFFEPRGYLEDDQLLYYTDPVMIAEKMSGVIPDYVNSNVGFSKTHPEPPESRYVWISGDETRNLEAIVDRGHEFAIEVPSDATGTVRVNIFEFPGWTFFINGEEVGHRVALELPVYEIELPDIGDGGELLVSGRLMDTSVRQGANLLSMTSVFILTGLFVRRRTTRGNKQ